MPHSLVWLNGLYIPRDEACISPLDAGFLLGDGLFETMRAYAGRILDLDRHLDRLAASAAALDMPLPPIDTLSAGLTALIERNACRDARARLTVTRGPADGEEPATTAFAHTSPLPPHALADAPVTLAVASLRLDPGSPLAGHKITSFLPYLTARREAVRAGADEALLLNHAGRVAECSTANLFAVIDGTVCTPPLSDGPLPGIVRAVVLDLCDRLGLLARESLLTVDAMGNADEVFITNSLREVAPVRAIDGTALPDAPGPVTRRIADAYAQRVRELTGATS